MSYDLCSGTTTPDPCAEPRRSLDDPERYGEDEAAAMARPEPAPRSYVPCSKREAA